MRAMRVSKQCHTCKRVKLLDEFTASQKDFDRLYFECRRCKAIDNGVRVHDTLSPLPRDKRERVGEAILRAMEASDTNFDREHDARAALEELTA